MHGSNTSYAAREATVNSASSSKVSSANWQITVGNNSAQLGTNAKSGNLSKTTLGNGSFDYASGVASALSITTSTTKYAAAYCTTGMSNITKGELIFTGTNGGNPTTAWLLSSTNGTSWTIESSKTSSITTGSTFTVTKSSSEKKFAFVCYWNLTNAGGLKGFEFKLYGQYDNPQIISGATEAFTDETVTLTTTATSPTWSIVTDSTTASGANVTSGGVVSVTGSGKVVVKSTAAGYADATHTITFSERPTEPYISLSLNSGDTGYTGQTVSISAEYGNGVTGLDWSVEQGTVSNITSSNSGFEGTLASSGTIKIRATDKGSSLYEEVSVTVTQTTLTLNKATTSIKQGKSETLTATYNVGSAIWGSDNAKVSVDNGVVTVASDAAVGSNATITATSSVDANVSASCVVTVLEQPPVYEIQFGNVKNSSANELTTETFLSKYSVDSNVSCTEISKVYGNDSTNMLKCGSNSFAASITLSIPANQYITSVEAIVSSGKNLNLQVQSGASGSTMESQNITDADTYVFDDYLETEKSNVVTISSSANGAFYLTALNLYYATKTPSITISPSSCTIFTNETAQATVTIANFASNPSLESYIVSGASSIDDVEIGSITGNEATVTISPTTTAGEAVVRIRDAANPSLYYADITVTVNAVPSHYMVLSASTTTGTDYGYKGDILEIDVTSSSLAGDIVWTVTSGSVSDQVYDNTAYMATLSSVGQVTITATDSGDNTNTQSVTVNVVDSLNSVMADITTEHESSLVFTKAYGEGPATTDDDKTWTVSSDGTESNYDSTKGIHYGTGSAAVQYIKANSSSYSSLKITKIVVNASAASGVSATVGVKVGSKQFGGDPQSIGTTAEEYSFTGNETASSIEVEVTKPSSANKALYLKSIVVTYETSSGEVDISNKAGMHKAQQAVIDYANDFLDTLDDICVSYGSTDLDALSEAWGNLATQYDNWFNNGAKDLSTDEIDQAKNLFAYASANKTGDVLQRMVDQYDWIVSHYGTLDNFLHDDAGRDSLYDSTGRVAILADVNSSNIIPIIVIVSLISVSAIGGYFYIRRRKEHN